MPKAELKADVEYLTPRVVARRWSCSTWSVRHWAAKGRIPGAAKLGNEWRIPTTATLIELPAAACTNLDAALGEIDRLTVALRETPVRKR